MGVSADRRNTSRVDFAERRSQLLYHSEHPKPRGEPLHPALPLLSSR